MFLFLSDDITTATRLAENFDPALTHSFPGRLDDFMKILFFNFSY